MYALYDEVPSILLNPANVTSSSLVLYDSHCNAPARIEMEMASAVNWMTAFQILSLMLFSLRLLRGGDNHRHDSALVLMRHPAASAVLFEERIQRCVYEPFRTVGQSQALVSKGFFDSC